MVIIIGSGAGGGILAYELSKVNIPVTIIDKGDYIETNDGIKHYDAYDENIDLLTTTCVGGSTIVSMANMVRALDNELNDYGIDLTDEYDYVEKLINVHEMDDSHIGDGTRLFLDAAGELGLNVSKMPKAVYEEKCVQCGMCALGCPVDGKWTSKSFVDDAIENGAQLITGAENIGILTENNAVAGVKYSKDGEEFKLQSDIVVLCAGAINSPLYLRKLGISNAGRKLFFDPFVTIGGVIKGINFNKELQMAGLVIGDNFVLSPHFSSFIRDKIHDETVSNEDILAIMVKTPDDGKGYINDDGSVVKENTINDIRYMAEGCAAAGMILEKAGVDVNTIKSTVYRGAHPGGSAAIGEIVDSNLETSIEGLFVDDASVLPISPGKPPILTILALSKRLADYLKIEN
ncbi:MAG: GMC family oxidoreductase N-terminal domain-containing protein [Methanobrevibacter sp.]|uniref:GMC family oxidoreductase N-terminal domain-containing protein n=1 Tax=Methanobrevibacter sp. TaxID=66852 RepID=UPI0026DF31BA|nr:GMC family oxidoreductase N-terminal domain-containing protein [Methanobrevibacter sp.]MDO5848285.1 GMC family oxidoreductase N-terminal domain-containing protein [Methanobrevibacter sp.]